MPCLVKCAALSMDEGYQMHELIITIVHFKSHCHKYSELHFILSLHCEEDQEVLDGILPMEPSTGLKRQFPNDSKDAHDVNAPGKIPKKGQ